MMRPNGSRTTFSTTLSGLPTQVTDANGRVMTMTYDGLRRPSHDVVWRRSVGRLLIRRRLEHAATITDYRGTTTQVTDERGRLISRTEPDGSTVEYVYDDGDRLVAVETPFGRTEYTYDLGDRLTSVTDATGTTTFTYDEVDNLVQGRSASSGVSRTRPTTSATSYSRCEPRAQRVNADLAYTYDARRARSPRSSTGSPGPSQPTGTKAAGRLIKENGRWRRT